MKKKYEKPVLELVEFEVNEAIAACEGKIYASVEACKDRLDPAINLAEGCTHPVPPEMYCYNGTMDGGFFTS